jgi:tRNA threonylcarbamoyl adenosine modification protein (Sua5/YciO/YrdC/YwlC family)
VLIKIDPESPNSNHIDRVVGFLKSEKVIAYPTDTVYGIGCELSNRKGIERIYQMKHLSRHKPLSLICKDLKEISQYAVLSNQAHKLMKRLLPGPYTFILKATREVPKLVLTNQRTVGIRIPDNKICLSVAQNLDYPLINTSALTSDNEFLSDPVEIDKKFGFSLDLVVDGGLLISDPSTILDLTQDTVQVVREGKGSLDFLMTKT